MRILEEFWYGNIKPTEYDTSSCKEYKKLQALICRNEEKLKATMTDEQKELFKKYADCVREHQTNTDFIVFFKISQLIHFFVSHTASNVNKVNPKANASGFLLGELLICQLIHGMGQNSGIVHQPLDPDVLIRLMLPGLIIGEIGTKGQCVGQHFGVCTTAYAYGVRRLTGVFREDLQQGLYQRCFDGHVNTVLV